MVMLGRLPLIESTDTIESVSISGSFKVQDNEQRDILSLYKKSNSFHDNMSLYEFFMKKKGQTKEQCTIIPHFIGGSGQPCYPVNENYARSILLIHKPWCPKNMNGIDKNVIAKFIEFLDSSLCPSSVKISYERVKARHETKMTHFECVSGDILDDEDIVEDDNLDCTTKDILASIGSLTAKAQDYVETDSGYTFDRGTSFAWDVTTNVVSLFC